MTRVISFSSGKGGVGKTTLVANLGTCYARQGKRTLLMDGDWALGKLGITLGVRPQWTIQSVLREGMSIEKAVHRLDDSLHLMSSPSGLIGFEELSESERNHLYFEIEALCGSYDLILFDHASGLNWNVLQFAAAAHHQVIVTTPEPTAMTDAYAIMKILSKRFRVEEFLLVVTMAAQGENTKTVIGNFIEHACRQLQIQVSLVEVFSFDSQFGEAVRRQKPFLDLFPQSVAAEKFRKLGEKLERKALVYSSGLEFFYQPQLALTSS